MPDIAYILQLSSQFEGKSSPILSTSDGLGLSE